MMAPVSGIGIIWALIDIAVCHYHVLNPVYYLSESVILGAGNAVLGAMSIAFYR